MTMSGRPDPAAPPSPPEPLKPPLEPPSPPLAPLEPPSPPLAPLDVDALIAELGGLGRYQLRTIATILPPILCCAVYMSQYIFNAAAVDHRCLVPECESVESGWAVGEWAEWALPPGAPCLRYRPNAAPGASSNSCSADAFTRDTVPCERRVYEDYDRSIVATFDLGCSEWRRTLVGSVHSAGLLFALPLTGYFSDRFGRRATFVCTATGVAAMGVARSFANSYTVYLVFEFLDSAVGSGVYTCGFILAMELLGSERRVLGGSVMSAGFALGQALLAALALLAGAGAGAAGGWRPLTRWLYAPSALFAGYALLLPESVRWLLAKGRLRDAAAIIFHAAKVNGIKLSPWAVAQLSRPDGDGDGDRGPPPATVREIVRSRIIMGRLAVCSFWWVSTTLVYYGLSINAVSLSGNSYLNFALSSLVELPGYALSVLTLDRWGRKRSLGGAFSLCGVALLSLPLVPRTLPWLSTCLGLLGKLCISMAFSSIYMYTAELFPTAARHRLLAACSCGGRGGSLLAPQTPLLTAVAEWLPYVVFGAMSACCAGLAALLPETAGRPLPDTVGQAERLAGPTRGTAPTDAAKQQPS